MTEYGSSALEIVSDLCADRTYYDITRDDYATEVKGSDILAAVTKHVAREGISHRTLVVHVENLNGVRYSTIEVWSESDRANPVRMYRVIERTS